MPEPRPLASLTAGLLARKGSARPAIRPAFVPREPAPVVVTQQARLAAAFAAPAPAVAAERTSVAMTLRLDAERHLKLKLLAARRRVTSRALLVEALDALFEKEGPEGCVCGAKPD